MKMGEGTVDATSLLLLPVTLYISTHFLQCSLSKLHRVLLRFSSMPKVEIKLLSRTTPPSYASASNPESVTLHGPIN